MATCPQCEGEGTCAYEEAVVDYEHGGYLEEVYGECDMCWGSGEVEDDDDPEDISGPYSPADIGEILGPRTEEPEQ